MSVYHGKLLELVEIEKKSDKYFLHIKFSFEQDIRMLWEIDEYTAENLKSVTELGKRYKYRLSFHSSWNVAQEQHISLLTRTYREQSDQIYFPCSENYINELTSLKHIQHINDLGTLNFIFANLAPINKLQDEQKQEQNEKASLKKYNRKFTWTFITVISLLSAILFGHLSNIYQNKDSFNKKALAQSIPIDNEEDTIQNEKLYRINNRLVKNISSNQPTIPFIELEDPITYCVPEGSVALTFDDGPSTYSKEIVDILKKYEVGGTFFLIGLNVKKYPDHVQYIHSNGYSIGSHSMNHISVSDLSYEMQENELIKSSNLINEITKEEIIFFRPPYGVIDEHTKALMHDYEYKIVLWNNDPKDWKTRDADKIFNDIQNSDVSGSIILLHESEAVVDALPRIIEYLQGLDLQIVNLQ